MDLAALHALKQTLIRNTDPTADSMRAFEALGNDPGFMDQGVEVESRLIEAAVQDIGREVFGKARLDDFALCRHPDHLFTYGLLSINRRTGTLLFFDDIGIGIVSLFLNRREVRLVRFEVRPLPVGHDVHRN